MELKEFVKKVILDLDNAISEANTETDRNIKFKGVKEHRTALEFDIAVTVESTDTKGGGGHIKVWGIGEAGGDISKEFKNSTVSRVSFGVDISEETKKEIEAERAAIQSRIKKTQERNFLNSAR